MLLDFLGSLVDLLATYYFIRMHSNAWIFSFISIGLNSWLYWKSGIYADMGLESFYLVTSLYGYYRWKTTQKPLNDNQEHNRIKKLTIKKYCYLLGGVLLLFLFFRTLLQKILHSDVANLDALTTCLSLAAQWLMCHKVIGTWILWGITDALFAILYLQKGLPFHVILMVFYLGLAITGYITWMKMMQKNAASNLRVTLQRLSSNLSKT